MNGSEGSIADFDDLFTEFPADLALLDDALQVRGTWIGGQYEAA